MSDQPTLGVIGVGYVGLVTAACFAEVGFTVICRDIVPEKIERLNNGDIPFFEPGLAELVARNRDRLTFTTELTPLTSAADIIFVCVDTPPTYSGDADLSRVETVISDLPDDVDDVILCMKSTVPVGTGRRLIGLLRERGLRGVNYCSTPEFLKEGDAIDDFMKPDRVVVGGDDATSVDRVVELHAQLAGERVTTSVETAEMIKYASNAFLATKISFINEIANVCEETGADVNVVAHGMGLDQRIGTAFLRAGIGFGGSCFPKDVAALKQIAGNSGYHFQLLNSVIEVNELQKRRVVQKLLRHLGTLRGKTVALLGLAFKPGTDDMRDAASLVIASRLLAEGATVMAHDPIAGDAARDLLPQATIADTVEDAVNGADAVVIVTEWPQYSELDLAALAASMRTPVLIDGRNVFDPARALEAGFVYDGIGRGHVPSGAAVRTSSRLDRRT